MRQKDLFHLDEIEFNLSALNNGLKLGSKHIRKLQQINLN
jgi:hypothetical protein